MKELEIHNELLICRCENIEHQLIFRYDNEDKEVYMSTHLRKMSFWNRLRYGIKYIFGYQSRYGAFDEFIFNPDDVHKLEKIIDHLKSE